MIRALVGFTVGYLVGARAGRTRHDQIAAMRTTVHPAVQCAAGFLQAKASGLPHPGQAVRRPDATYPTRQNPDRSTVSADRPVETDHPKLIDRSTDQSM